MSQQIVERRVQSLSKSGDKSLRQAHEGAIGPGVEIGCGYFDVYAQFEGEAFAGVRLPFAGAEDTYE